VLAGCLVEEVAAEEVDGLNPLAVLEESEESAR
jgi:hypothetical protein